MIISSEIRSRYTVTDADTAAFLDMFDEPAGSKIMEVGSHDEPVANILAEMGFNVTGVDFREYDKESPPCNYNYMRADFCTLPIEFVREHIGTFDTIIALSAIEHFGLSCYQEEKNDTPTLIHGRQAFLDVIAMRTIWQFLREGGTAYVSVPFGGFYMENYPHWRVYNLEAMSSRLVVDFQLEWMRTIVADWIALAETLYSKGGIRNTGDMITAEEALTYTGIPPHLTALLKLKKVPVKRLAPDGR